MKFKEILIWLIIFIVGSLIVSFLVSPNSFSNLKDNFKSINTQKSKVNYTEVEIPSALGINKCSIIEAAAIQNGISEKENKRRLCTYYCGESDLEFGYYGCITDEIHCYCILN